MAAPAHVIPFSVTDLKVATLTGETPGTLTDLPGIRKLTLKFASESQELRGDNTVIAAVNNGLTCEWELEEGGLDIPSLKIITGLTDTQTGTTPAIKTRIDVKGDHVYPYFYLCGMTTTADGVGSFEIHIPRAKITGDLSLELNDGEFMTPTLSGQGVARASDKLLAALQAQETSAAMVAIS